MCSSLYSFVWLLLFSQALAVQSNPQLMAELRERPPQNSWERNLALYQQNPLCPIKAYRVPARGSTTDLTSALIKAANLEEKDQASFDDSEAYQWADAVNDPDSIDDAEVKEEPCLMPRSFGVFYQMLKGVPIRQRPRVQHCEMCNSEPCVHAEVVLLQQLLERKAPSTTQVSAFDTLYESDDDAAAWGIYGDRATAEERLRALLPLDERRQQHIRWYRTQRKEVGAEVYR